MQATVPPKRYPENSAQLIQNHGQAFTPAMPSLLTKSFRSTRVHGESCVFHESFPGPPSLTPYLLGRLDKVFMATRTGADGLMSCVWASSWALISLLTLSGIVPDSLLPGGPPSLHCVLLSPQYAALFPSVGGRAWNKLCSPSD